MPLRNFNPYKPVKQHHPSSIYQWQEATKGTVMEVNRIRPLEEARDQLEGFGQKRKMMEAKSPNDNIFS